MPGTAPAGIVTKCPGMMPTPIAYEWQIPFSALKIAAGSPHTFRMAIVHAQAHWPDGLAVPAGGGLSVDPSTWGTLTSSANWQ
jgi:hypothetical protein